MRIQKPTRAVGSAIIKIEATKYDASRFLSTSAVKRVVCYPLNMLTNTPYNDASRFLPTRAVGEWQFHNLS